MGKLVFLWLALSLIGCSPNVYTVQVSYNARVQPASPDYSRPEHWAALPDKRDAADSVPLNSNLHDGQLFALADVFFVYPTSTPENHNPIFRGTPIWPTRI